MKEKLPKITVVTPSYNQAEFLERTILSIINQNYPNLEYFIFDGGSNDNSVEIIKKYEKYITHWVSEKDNGQTDAINKGFKLATGDIISWLNSDDLYYPGSLFTVAKYFEKYPEVGMLYGDSHSIDQDDIILRKNKNLPFSSTALWTGIGLITQPASFVRRNILDRVGFLDEYLDWLMDIDWFLRMDIQGIKIKKIPEVLCYFRYHNTSKTVAFQAKVQNERHFLLEEKHKAGKYITQNKRKLLFIYYRLKRFVLNIPSKLIFFITPLKRKKIKKNKEIYK